MPEKLDEVSENEDGVLELEIKLKVQSDVSGLILIRH